MAKTSRAGRSTGPHAYLVFFVDRTCATYHLSRREAEALTRNTGVAAVRAIASGGKSARYDLGALARLNLAG